jgi:hypothetical protein
MTMTATRPPGSRAKPAAHEPYPTEIDAIRAMPYGLRGFRRFAKLLGLTIWPFQAAMLRLHFAGVVELVILIPKKNGKTTLLAALALYHLLVMPRAEVVIGAASKEQAARLHEAAANLIYDAQLDRHALPGDRREPTRYAGVFEVREGMHVIRFERGRIRVLPHEVRGGDGVMPTLALVDELHRHPTGALYGVFRDGIDAQDGQMITISTAGASMDTPLGRLLDRARELPAKVTDRRHVYTSPDGAFTVVEWALHPDDDPHKITNVLKVNPAPWLTRRKLQQRHDSPSMSTGQWLRFACGIWTEGEEPAITGSDWDRLRADIGAIAEGDTVVLAPSVGHDAAVGIAATRPDGRVAVAAITLPASEGRSILEDTEACIARLAQRYDVARVDYDRHSFGRSAELLLDQGLPMVLADHSVARKIGATSEFMRLLRSRSLIHDGDKALRASVLAGMLRTTEQGERFMVSERSRALIAVMCAAYAATAPTDTPTIMLPTIGGLG